MTGADPTERMASTVLGSDQPSSSHAMMTCAPLRYRSLTSMPSRSTSSSVGRRPAVSTRRSGQSSNCTRASIASRVVPGTSVTIARFSPTIALKSDDFPTFGRPAITTIAPSRTSSVAGAVSSRPQRRSRTVSAASLISCPVDWSVVLLGKVDVVRKQGFEIEQAIRRSSIWRDSRHPVGERPTRRMLSDVASIRSPIASACTEIELAVEHCPSREFTGLASRAPACRSAPTSASGTACPP